MNSNSSRSHAIFTIYLGTENRQNVKRESIINLVDLAGSEGFRKNENMKKEARAECKNINEGLLAFKRVIDAMAKQRNHIPSRESAITTILKGLFEQFQNVEKINPMPKLPSNTFKFISNVPMLFRLDQHTIIFDIIGLCQS